MAALNRFISRSVDRCRRFFLLLHKWKEFEWTDECVMAFQQLKQYLSRPPIMSNPVVDEVLFAYIAIAFYAISFVLIWVDSGIQSPVYYVSKSLNEAEVHYLPLEKGYIGGGACYKKTSPLFPSTHRGCSHPTSTQVNTPKCRLYWKGCQMGHNPRGF